MSRANAGHIRNGTQEQIHDLLDDVKKGIDENLSKFTELDVRTKAGETGLEETKIALAKQEDVLKTIEERLHNLDSQLEQGQKLYESVVEDKDAKSQKAREDFARMILDVGAVSLNKKPIYGSSAFLAQTEVTTIGSNSGDVLGGFTVPDEQRNEIVRVVQQFGVARRLCRVIPMAGKTLKIPTNNTLPDVFWDTEIGTSPPNTRELSAPDESVVKVARPEVEAHKLIAIDTLSIELDQDSIPSMAAFVTDVFGIAVSKEEDYQCLVSPGTGNEPFTGLLKVAGIAEVTGSDNTYLGSLISTGDDGGYNKLLAVMDAADEDAVDNGVWVFSNSILNGLRQVKDTTGQPLFGQMVAGAPGTLFGRPYIRSRIMPHLTDAGSQASKGFILFGNFNYHVMGDRMKMAIDVSPHAAFREAGLVMRVMERIAFKTLLTEPFARMKTAA